MGVKKRSMLLKTAFERATKGNLELVLVTGYAGIGKTAFVQEALQQMTIGKVNRQFILVRADLIRFTKIFPIAPLRRRLERLFGKFW